MTKPAVVHLRSLATDTACRIFAFATRRLQLCCLTLVLAALFSSTQTASTQGRYTLFGDLKVDESKVQGQLPASFQLILYSLGGTVVGRQNVPPGGRYRFLGLRGGDY